MSKKTISEDRVITLVLRVEDMEEANSIWEKLKTNGRIHGCAIMALQDGDAIAECEELSADLLYNSRADLPHESEDEDL